MDTEQAFKERIQESEEHAASLDSGWEASLKECQALEARLITAEADLAAALQSRADDQSRIDSLTQQLQAAQQQLEQHHPHSAAAQLATEAQHSAIQAQVLQTIQQQADALEAAQQQLADAQAGAAAQSARAAAEQAAGQAAETAAQRLSAMEQGYSDAVEQLAAAQAWCAEQSTRANVQTAAKEAAQLEAAQLQDSTVRAEQAAAAHLAELQNTLKAKQYLQQQVALVQSEAKQAAAAASAKQRQLGLKQQQLQNRITELRQQNTQLQHPQRIAGSQGLASSSPDSTPEHRLSIQADNYQELCDRVLQLETQLGSVLAAGESGVAVRFVADHRHLSQLLLCAGNHALSVKVAERDGPGQLATTRELHAAPAAGVAVQHRLHTALELLAGCRSPQLLARSQVRTHLHCRSFPSRRAQL